MESGEVKPKQKVFFDEKVFDAYEFLSNMFRSAERTILIIDNYVDDTVLTQLKLDADKFNEQYEAVELIEFKLSHDRFEKLRTFMEGSFDFVEDKLVVFDAFNNKMKYYEYWCMF